MNNYNESIVGTLLSMVDKYSANFIANSYQHLVTQYSSVIYLFVTIYVGLVFINMLRGNLEVKDFPFIVLKITIILTLGMNYQYFYIYIYNVFTNGPLEICKAITIGGGHAASTTIVSALDNFLKEGFTVANKLFSMGGWNNVLFTIFGVGICIVTMIAGAVAAGLIFLSKIASAVLLALSPIFIFFALYDATKGWFDSYIQHLFGYALIPIMACAVMMVTLSVTETTVDFMKNGDLSFKLILPFIIACAIQIWLFLQIPQKCASLASGFSLKSFSASMKDANAAMRSLANLLPNNSLKNGLSQATSKMNRYRKKD